MTRFLSSVAGLLRDSARLCVPLYKIMIPILIAVKIAKELGVIEVLARPLGPSMSWVGLPPEMGLVWATAMFNNIYGALIVFAGLSGNLALTEAQATVLGVMILVAHNLPMEIRIAQATGSRPLFQLFLRVGGALALGFLVGRLYGVFDLHAEPAAMLWKPAAEASPGLASWAWGEVRNLAMVYLIVTGLLLFLRLLEAIRATRAMHRLLAPVFRLLGIGPEATTLTVIGLTMGVAYGGGLILEEARSGRMAGREVFCSLSFLGLCHSLFEDSLLLASIGGQLSGLIVARLLFALLVAALLARLVRRLSNEAQHRWLWRPLAS